MMGILLSCDRCNLFIFVWILSFINALSAVYRCPNVGPEKCHPEFCRNVQCPPPIQCPNGYVAENGSLCGCLDICVKYLDEGSPCSNIEQSRVTKQKCKHGLYCNGNCTLNKKNFSCITDVKWRGKLKSHFLYEAFQFSQDLWIPECDEKGFYRIKQCKKKKCFCVNENGTRIFGQEERDLVKNMTCGCSKEMWTLKKSHPDIWMTKPMPHCTKSGDYDHLQCQNDICYCADPMTGECKGRVTKMEFIEMLPCYNPKKHSKLYVTQCEKELIRTKSLSYQFKQKNITIKGLEVAGCDTDGTFAPKQCETSRCVCTDRNGIGIKSYHIEKKKREVEIQQMTCRCARDEYDKEIHHVRYPSMLCEENGNFVPLQCTEENCRCVDDDGDNTIDELPSQLQKTQWSTYCTEALAILKNITLLFTQPSKINVTEAPDTDVSDDYYNELG